MHWCASEVGAPHRVETHSWQESIGTWEVELRLELVGRLGLFCLGSSGLLACLDEVHFIFLALSLDGVGPVGKVTLGFKDQVIHL